MEMSVERKAYTAKEVAEMLGISKSNVYKMIKRRLLTAVPIGQKEIRIPRQSLEDYLSGLNNDTVKGGKSTDA